MIVLRMLRMLEVEAWRGMHNFEDNNFEEKEHDTE